MTGCCKFLTFQRTSKVPLFVVVKSDEVTLAWFFSRRTYHRSSVLIGQYGSDHRAAITNGRRTRSAIASSIYYTTSSTIIPDTSCPESRTINGCCWPAIRVSSSPDFVPKYPSIGGWFYIRCSRRKGSQRKQWQRLERSEESSSLRGLQIIESQMRARRDESRSGGTM